MKLFVGLEAPEGSDVIHLPLISIVPREAVTVIDATHIIVTSKTAVTLAEEPFRKSSATFISVGAATTARLEALGITDIVTAKNECQEGIIDLIQQLKLHNPTFFWARSSGARTILTDYLRDKNYPYVEHLLYDTVFVQPKATVDFSKVKEIHFSSPSTVDAFLHFFDKPPVGIKLHAKGHVTEAHMKLRDVL